MNQHKIGRPTEAKKDCVIKARVDSKTIEKLEQCVEKKKLSKSEILRIGIEKVYEDIVGEEIE